jgi:hypothetical protein
MIYRDPTGFSRSISTAVGDLGPVTSARPRRYPLLAWGGVTARYTLLADPTGWYFSLSATPTVESQRPFEIVPCTETPNADPCASLDGRQDRSDVGIGQRADSREAHALLFAGGGVGHRFRLGERGGLQVELSGRAVPLPPLGTERGREGLWLEPFSLTIGLQANGVLTR